MDELELVRRVQRAMMAAGFFAAAQNLPERWLIEHSPYQRREIAKAWLG